MPNYDFTVVSDTPINGISLVISHNEDAFNYIQDELDYTILKDGSTPLFSDAVGDFISDAENAHLSCEYV